jgi:hypothetical protein
LKRDSALVIPGWFLWDKRRRHPEGELPRLEYQQWLRKALYFPAIAAIKYNPYVRRMSERLKARGKCPMQIIGAAMRKLIHIAYGVLKSGRPFDPGLKTA